mgnify:CR=1 FL=1
MSVAETLLLGLSVGFCLLLAWAIHRRGAVGLIAGYDRDLPPEREAELARDARSSSSPRPGESDSSQPTRRPTRSPVPARS